MQKSEKYPQANPADVASGDVIWWNDQKQDAENGNTNDLTDESNGWTPIFSTGQASSEIGGSNECGADQPEQHSRHRELMRLRQCIERC